MKIREILGEIGIDKYEHCLLAALSAVVLKVILGTAMPCRTATLVAGVLTFVMCVGKEIIYDKWMGKGTPEWKDLLAGVVGILIGVL